MALDHGVPLVRGRSWATGADWVRGGDPGSLTHSLSLSLSIHLSDTAATCQDGSIFRMQGAEGCELVHCALPPLPERDALCPRDNLSPVSLTCCSRYLWRHTLLQTHKEMANTKRHLQDTCRYTQPRCVSHTDIGADSKVSENVTLADPPQTSSTTLSEKKEKNIDR